MRNVIIRFMKAKCVEDESNPPSDIGSTLPRKTFVVITHFGNIRGS